MEKRMEKLNYQEQGRLAVQLSAYELQMKNLDKNITAQQRKLVSKLTQNLKAIQPIEQENNKLILRKKSSLSSPKLSRRKSEVHTPGPRPVLARRFSEVSLKQLQHHQNTPSVTPKGCDQCRLPKESLANGKRWFSSDCVFNKENSPQKERIRAKSDTVGLPALEIENTRMISFRKVSDKQSRMQRDTIQEEPNDEAKKVNKKNRKHGVHSITPIKRNNSESLMTEDMKFGSSSTSPLHYNMTTVNNIMNSTKTTKISLEEKIQRFLISSEHSNI